MTDIESFLKERNQAFIELDEGYVFRKMPESRPEIRLMILHKSRYECLQIPTPLRNESAEWLRERGLKRVGGIELLPKGELPK
jgi:hypothetical protein